jgi:uncharacterized protein (TIGR00251 family)
MTDNTIRADGSDVLLRVRVQPRASREAVVGEAEGRLRVALTAPPVEGAANDALRRFLASRLGVARGRVTLEAGEKSREKTLRIGGLSESAVREALGL